MSIYTPTARFDTARALTEDEMRSKAPSIFATHAHDSRSERFQPIPTIEILRGLQKEGFMPVGVQQSTTRDASRVEFTKHLIRLRKIEDDHKFKVGDTVCEILLKNANDGTCQYELLAGLFRIRCLNSLVAQTGTIDAVKVRHSGDVQSKVIDGTFRVLNEAHNALAAPENWGAISLNREEREIFANAVHTVRFGEEETGAARAIQPAQLLIPRRFDDRAEDLWTTFNVAQENTIRGGLRGVTRDANNRRRRVSTRQINGIDQNVKLNKALWTLAEEMAKLKRAA